jgi:hypothetical protein
VITADASQSPGRGEVNDAACQALVRNADFLITSIMRWCR